MYLSTYFWNFCILGKSFWRPATLYDMCPKSTSSREGNGTPCQCSCLENPRDGRACWAAVYGDAQSQTRQRDLAAAAAAALQASVSATLTAVLRLSLLIPCFSRSLLPNSLQAHQHLRNLFGKFLIKSLTDGLPAKHRYSFFMFTGGPASHVGARKEVEPLQDCAPALLLERRWVPSTG